MTHVDERTARRVAEEARQTEWELPSFGKQLFLGDFRLDLIHPHPEGTEKMRHTGEEFLTRVREFCETKVDAADHRARRPDPRRGDQGPEGPGRLRHEDLRGVRRARAQPALLQPRADAGRLGAPGARRAAVGPPVHRRAAAGQDVRHRGAEADLPAPLRPDEISAFLLTEPDVGIGPGAAADGAPSADGDDYVLDGVKLWTTNGVVADLLVVMARVPAVRGAPRRHHRVRRRGDRAPGSRSRTATPSWACAASRTASPASTRCACPPRTASARRARASRSP